jgi:hypothetical protein
MPLFPPMAGHDSLCEPSLALVRPPEAGKPLEGARTRGLCRHSTIAKADEGGQWPGDFFTTKLNDEDLQLLRDGVSEMERAIISARSNSADIDL